MSEQTTAEILADLEAAGQGIIAIAENFAAVVRKGQSAAELGRNADGDSMEDMRAVVDALDNTKAVEYAIGVTGRWVPQASLPNDWTTSGTFKASEFRLTAKHADTFDPECMDFEVWARAAIGRGLVLRHNEAFYHTSMGPCVGGGEVGVLDVYGTCRNGCKWNAITREAYEQETAPEEPPIDSVWAKSSDSGRWVPMSDFAQAVAAEIKKQEG